jgi:hypothetical protein
VSIKLYRVEFSAAVSFEVAAPSEMSEAEVQTLIRAQQSKLLLEEDPRWRIEIDDGQTCSLEEVQRQTWVVHDSRQALVLGEDTDWLLEAASDEIEPDPTTDPTEG